MPWHARLELDYTLKHDTTVLHHRHEGPLRVFQSLHPEGKTICHNVVVHPPGGLANGDVVDIAVNVGHGAHAWIGTPGATRFYRSGGEAAKQQITLRVQDGARLEWLPLETLAYSGCLAHNTLSLQLAPTAEALLWDVLALGQPTAGKPFEAGAFTQRLSVPDLWLEQAHIRADDTRLLDAPLGLDGQRCMGTLVFASGTALGRDRTELVLDTVRSVCAHHPLSARAGATSPNPQMVVLRVLGPVVEPVMDLLQQVWSALRPTVWSIAPQRPRIWDV
ncbi:urease accessory protein UreD [Hydrogenophaga atypica]|uniref:Urease accessory protein UreD n=1 Tax=Hydrogenophaga atypica TaxID=249409 RepID=A0ABW2QGR6_9BURK